MKLQEDQQFHDISEPVPNSECWKPCNFLWLGPILFSRESTTEKDALAWLRFARSYGRYGLSTLQHASDDLRYEVGVELVSNSYEFVRHVAFARTSPTLLPQRPVPRQYIDDSGLMWGDRFYLKMELLEFVDELEQYVIELISRVSAYPNWEGLKIDFDAGRITYNDEELQGHWNQNHLNILAELLKTPGKPVTHAVLMKAIDAISLSAAKGEVKANTTLNNYVTHLRNALEHTGLEIPTHTRGTYRIQKVLKRIED